MNLRPLTEMQLAALRAALLPPPACLHAWATLRQLSGDLNDSDRSTFRALPMVYRNLESAGVEASELRLLRGIYRQAWYRNQIVMQTGVDAVTVLREAGIEPIALKGLGLIPTVYQEPALRPMDDVDLLLPSGQWERAARVLLARGWLPTRGTTERFFRRGKVFHGMPLARPGGVEVDLHRVILEENTGRGADGSALGRLVEATVNGVTVRTLSPEDHAIHACVHGTRWDWAPSLRWILDLSTLLKSERAFDWQYVVAESRRRRVTTAMAAALRFASSLEIPIPDGVIEDLDAAPASRMERWAFQLQQTPDNLMTLTGRTVTRYLRMATGRPFSQKVLGFPVYLEWVWGLGSPKDIPRDIVRRVRRRLR